MPFGLKICGCQGAESRKFRNRFFGFYLVMMMFYVVEHYVLKSRNSPLWYVVAVGFIGSFVCALWSFGLMAYRQKDEFHKALMAQAAIWSAVVTMTAATVWGFLETSGKVPQVPLIFVPLAFVVLTAFIFGALRFQNRTASE